MCAAGAAGCSRDSLGAGQGRDAAAGRSIGEGGVAAVGGSNGSGGFSGGGGLSTGTNLAGGAALGGTIGTGGIAGRGSISLDGGNVTDGGAGGLTGTGGLGDSGSAAVGGAGGTGGSAVDGSAVGGNSTDSGTDGALDAPAPVLDTRSADLPGYSDFNDLLAGVWLVGWSGGLRHYSWVRLSGKLGGTAEFLSGEDLPSNSPFWACSGQGTWFETEAFYSIMLRLPAACPSGAPTLFTFKGLPDSYMLEPGASLGMIAPSTISTQPPTEWWKYPDDQCDSNMSTCKSPF
jgi:hypothetical protein